MARRVILLAVFVAGLVCIGAAPAGADINGPCTGSGAFNRGTKARGPFTVNAQDLKPGDVVEVPVKDTVHWKGDISGVSGNRTIDGFVAVDLPWPFGEATIDTWGKSTDLTGNEGEHSYSLPSLIPRGVEFEVSGQHSENGVVVCSGTAKVKVEGSAFDSPLAPIGLGGTAISGVGLAFAGRPVFKKLWAKDDA
jgi:hypothetical protein